MRKSRLIWGIIFIVLAVVLAVLTQVLPGDQLMFMTDEGNQPLVGAALLAVAGIVLLATARRR